ncbi:MAG TPA: sigma-70 family RNA polymerase sigma factor [Candidatus Sulfotelmatobacter sp.]|nr:sigma-70 family RNA polymerase sigma factor [Candidatus Sulfotelmatobacter sp.]
MKAAAAVRELAWSDERLVRECRKGNQAAWSALIEKYKNLIFSIPIKFGLSREDAADIFQAVCVDLLSSLPQLREPRAIAKWLMQTSFHKCLRWKKDRLNLVDDLETIDGPQLARDAELPEEMLYQVQREQSVRDALATLPSRCGRMVSMLFFDDPPRPYQEVAKELGIASGSIGFIRGRCLKKMRQLLEEKGFR